MSTPAPAIQSVPLPDLLAEFKRQQGIRGEAAGVIEIIHQELDRRLGQNLKQNLLVAKGKEHGEGTDTIDGVKVAVFVGQKVTWDTEKLKAAYASQPGDVAEKIFKVAITVPETVFKNITDPALLEKLTEARTTKVNDPHVTFVTNE